MSDALIVAGIIRRDNQVLLVEQQGKDDPTSSWALPGGRVESGELLVDALVREVREETGLEVKQVGALAYLAQHTRLNALGMVTVFAFEIADWNGEIDVNDPDGFILQARFVSIQDAIQKLESTLPWLEMREPVVEYLRRNANPGTMWFCRRPSNGDDEFIAQLITQH